MLYGKLSFFEKLTGEDLSRYLNKIELIGLRKTVLAPPRRSDLSAAKCFNFLAIHHGGLNSWIHNK